MRYHIVALGIGFLLDLLWGDPRWLPHPVCMMGRCISWLETQIRKVAGDEKRKLLAGGAFITLFMVVCWTGIAGIGLHLIYGINAYVGMVVESFMCYQLLATKGLKSESMKVYHELKDGNLEGARYAVSMIVGRDTACLDEEGVIKATVETVAENLSDGVIAPLLFMAIGGAPFGYLYKAVNTMDSMIGYKDEKYLYIGRFSAKLDDVLNYIPARASALLMLVACPLLKLNTGHAWHIFKRDSRNHASPNSAQTESVAAGALGIQLAGDAYYFGKLYHKPTIGDDTRRIRKEDIVIVNHLLYATAWICIMLILVFGII